MAEKPTFGRNDVSRIREGVLAEEAGFKPLKNFGVDFTLRPSTVFGALPLGGFANIGQAIGKYQLEDSANKFYGFNKGFQEIEGFYFILFFRSDNFKRLGFNWN